MPATHHSVFTGRMPFLLPNQLRQSTVNYIVSQKKEANTLHQISTDFQKFLCTDSAENL